MNKIVIFHFFIIFALFSCESKSAKLSKSSNASEKPQLAQAMQSKSPTATQATVNFCIENSGSMFGYVSSAGNFTQVVTKLAGDFDLNCQTVNYSLQNGVKTSIGNTLTQLGNSLSVSGMNRGDVTKSDISLMLNEALEKAKGGQVSILISDGIYSISGGKDAIIRSLEFSSTQTRNNFVKALGVADLITYMIKFNSNFDGQYYPACGGEKSIKQQRPYYVWIIGHANQLQELFKEGYFENLPGFENMVKFIKLDSIKPNCGFVQHKPLGTSRYRGSLELSDVNPHRSEFSFSIAFDFSKHLLPLKYFDDKSVYENNLGYNVENIVRYDALTLAEKASAQEIIKNKGATHVVTFKRHGAPWGKMNISILNKKPQWIDASSTDDDCTVIEPKKTFGLSSLIGGISKAYEIVDKTPNLVEYEINVKQQQ
jgi:hypothetical protein